MSEVRPGESQVHTTGASEAAVVSDATAAADTGTGLPDGLAGSAWLKQLPPWAPIAILFGIGFVIHYPAVTSLFFLDDVIHRSMLEGYFPGGRHPLDLYSFVDDGNREELFARGLLPWWTHPNLTVRFFRPLSSALVWVDHAVLGGHPLVMHLHSLAWWVLAVLALRRLYRTAFSPRVAWIATLIFALAPCHALPLSWIANRDALLSLSFGLLGMVAYLEWRKGSVRHALVALLCFSLALAAGEYALSLLAYVGAYELVRKDRSLVVRALHTWPYVVPAAIYLGVRAHLGYGTERSGFYADPFSDPGIFLWHAPRRFAILLLEGWLAIAGDVITWEMPTWVLSVSVLVLAAAVLIGLRESFATLDAHARETASWMLVGSVIALVPVLAVVAAPRVLGASMIGIAATTAIIVDGAWFRPTPPRPGVGRELAVLAALFLGFCQLVRGPGEAWLQARHYRGGSYRFASQVDTFAALATEPGGEVVVARGLVGAFFIPFAIGEENLPRRHRLLAETSHVLAVRRGERSVELFSARDGGLFVAGEGCLFRDLRSPFAVGDVIESAGVRTTVTRVDDNRVTAALFELEEPLDELRFLNETRYEFEVAQIPPIGLGMPYDAGPRPDD